MLVSPIELFVRVEYSVSSKIICRLPNRGVWLKFKYFAVRIYVMRIFSIVCLTHFSFLKRLLRLHNVEPAVGGQKNEQQLEGSM